MADLVPAGGTAPQNAASLTAPLLDPAGGPVLTRIGTFASQGPVRKALPWFAGAAGVGLLALTWAVMSPAPQRVLYSTLNDAERASVVAALDGAGIAYAIDNQTGALTVGEDDVYRARMLVASDGALATPETGAQMLDSLPMGASRTLEGDRLRAAQERELELTIGEIDGVEGVRVHIAKPEKSVFVRDDVPPSASVMVRMARGRQLADTQVSAVANLVAASVPGLSIDSVRIVDQNGRLLLQARPGDADRIDLQARMEEKLRSQVEQLLAPMIGAGNFSSEIQVELDMAEVTSARETYDKDGAIRRETTQASQSGGAGTAAGVPGATANTPPLDPQAVPGAPEGTQAPAAGGAPQGNGESSTSRTYELGREVAVSNVGPGGLKRLSVAVALNQDALKGAKPADLKKIEDLVAAAVGADPQRGDRVAVVTRPFAAQEAEELPFWEAPWFAMIVRNAVALICVLLVLFLAVRPALKALTGRKDRKNSDEIDPTSAELAGALGEDIGDRADAPARKALADGNAAQPVPDTAQLNQQIELAQRIVREKPEDALLALRRMIGESPRKVEEAA